MESINIAGLMSSLKKESLPVQEKTASIASSLGGQGGSSELEKIANEVSEDIGMEVSFSDEIEKVASDMSSANTVEDIIKIAQDSGNEDLAHLATMAGVFADVIVGRVREHIQEG